MLKINLSLKKKNPVNKPQVSSNSAFTSVSILTAIDKEKNWVAGCRANLVGHRASVDTSVGEKSGAYCEIRGNDCPASKTGV